MLALQQLHHPGHVLVAGVLAELAERASVQSRLRHLQAAQGAVDLGARHLDALHEGDSLLVVARLDCGFDVRHYVHLGAEVPSVNVVHLADLRAAWRALAEGEADEGAGDLELVDGAGLAAFPVHGALDRIGGHHLRGEQLGDAARVGQHAADALRVRVVDALADTVVVVPDRLQGSHELAFLGLGGDQRLGDPVLEVLTDLAGWQPHVDRGAVVLRADPDAVFLAGLVLGRRRQ
jgi:hypothetical protein